MCVKVGVIGEEIPDFGLDRGYWPTVPPYPRRLSGAPDYPERQVGSRDPLLSGPQTLKAFDKREFMRITGRHVQTHPAFGAFDHRSDLDELQTDSVALGFGESGSFESDSADLVSNSVQASAESSTRH